MSTFQRRHKVLESLIKSWKHGHEVVFQELEVEGLPKAKTDKEVEDRQKVVTELQDDNHMTTERLRDKNTEKKALWTDNSPVSEGKVNVQNTK